MPRPMAVRVVSLPATANRMKKRSRLLRGEHFLAHGVVDQRGGEVVRGILAAVLRQVCS